MVTPTAIALALVIGGVMGLLGGGGSILAVPAFTFVLGLSPKQAVVTSLGVVGIAATVGAVRGLMRGLVPPVLALTVGSAATIGSFGGSIVGARLSDQAQLRILTMVMMAAAALIARPPDRAARRVDPPSPWLLLAIGLSIGALTGVAGVGGGFLIVPALVVAAGLNMQEAAGVSMVVIALAAASALTGYVTGPAFEWPLIVPLAAVAAAATLAGARLAARLPQRILQRAFAVCLVIIGSWVWVRA
jgi:uncharacterized membrane protein YfcA